jgi:hypothetical protein
VRGAAVGMFCSVALVTGGGGRAAANTAVRSERYAVAIQAVFDQRGDPILGANFSPDGSLAQPTFSICLPNPGRCKPTHAVHGELEPGREPAGTVFEASATYEHNVYSSRVIWHGTVATLHPPQLTGAARVGARVMPVAGDWGGGWGGETDQLGVEACRSSTGAECRMLGGGELGCPDQSSRPKVGNWYTGWYLFAVDARLAADDACAGTGYFSNADLPLWSLGVTVQRSVAAGRVTGPPPPRVAILRRAQIHGNRVLVARVSCVARCDVVLTADGARTGSSGHRSLVGTALVGVARVGLMPGRLHVTAHVAGSPAILGISRLK